MKHDISRRTMLRGLGVTMALPWLESLRVWGDVAKGAKKASESPVRMAIFLRGDALDDGAFRFGEQGVLSVTAGDANLDCSGN